MSVEVWFTFNKTILFVTHCPTKTTWWWLQLLNLVAEKSQIQRLCKISRLLVSKLFIYAVIWVDMDVTIMSCVLIGCHKSCGRMFADKYIRLYLKAGTLHEGMAALVETGVCCCNGACEVVGDNKLSKVKKKTLFIWYLERRTTRCFSSQQEKN